MYIEEHYWRERPSRAISRATRSLNSLLKTFWHIISFQIYRDSYKLVRQAVAVYGHGIGRFKAVYPTDKQVGAIVERVIDRQNAICWGVDCAHVARYLDKDYEQYTHESSQSYKLLWRLAWAVKNSDPAFTYEALNEAIEHIDSYEKAYADRKAPERPGDVARAGGDSVGDTGALS